MGKGRQHFSSVTGRWERCEASKKSCRYAGSEHRDVSVSAALDDAVEASARKVEVEKNAFLSGLDQYIRTSIIGAVKSEPGEVVVREDGRFQVLSETVTSRGEKEWYVFGDFTSLEEARKLEAADLLKVYQNGDCDWLASELWNCNPHVAEYYFFTTPEDPVFGVHHFVKLDDGSFADSMGVWSEEAFVSRWKDIDETVSLEVFALGKSSEKNPNMKVSNQKLFDTITAVIDRHFAGK